jgi:hypothetical protein
VNGWRLYAKLWPGVAPAVLSLAELLARLMKKSLSVVALLNRTFGVPRLRDRLKAELQTQKANP